MNVYKTKEIRKEESISKLKLLGIDYIENLPVTYSANEVKLKSLKEICGRYICNIISIQVAFDLLNDNEVDYSLNFFSYLLKKYDVSKYLNDLEKRVFNRKASEHELVNLTWQYEALNVLAWVIGIRKELTFPNESCECKFLVECIARCERFKDFIKQCELIDIEDILDELDLEYRYHWATVDKRINPSTNIGSLNEEIVFERRRALEWLVSKENDWNDISLDT